VIDHRFDRIEESMVFGRAAVPAGKTSEQTVQEQSA
jgi:hypothetical protein